MATPTRTPGPRRRMRRMLGLGLRMCTTFLVLGGANCNSNIAPAPAPPPGSWLVLLCRASDAPAEPKPVAFYTALFAKNVPDGLWAYFDTTSNHTVDISGSQVFGWFPMSVSTATISPAARNNTTSPNRAQTAQDCKASALGGIAATGISVDPANFKGTITVINVPVDAGAAANKSVVLSSHFESDWSFIEHEMLHVFGLKHSWATSADATTDHAWNHGGDVEYNDCWDMMSYATCAGTYQAMSGQTQGPEVQAIYRDKLGWLPSGRIWSTNQHPGAQQTVTLAPLADEAKPGSLLARVDVPPNGEYLVEYRPPVRFDAGVGAAAVVIREHRNNNLTYIVTRQGGRKDWIQGETFTDAFNFLSIAVTAMAPDAATVVINTQASSGTKQLDEKCGDKYHGEVDPCVPPLRCGARSHPPLVTIDYFCQA